MFYQIIESSSDGNCAYLQHDGVNILIDAGVGIRKIEKYLKSRDLLLSDIDAIFITHEHIDHYRALKSFAKYATKVYANYGTSESIKYKESKTELLSWHIFENKNAFDFMGIEVTAFPIPHDTSDAVGYKFLCGEKTLVSVTDLGTVTDTVFNFIKSANVLVLESNYCPEMLKYSDRPLELKRRISGRNGHLSNGDAITVLKSLSCDNIDRVYLAHLSKECNNMEHVDELMFDVGDIYSRIEIVSPYMKASTAFFC